ncbi:MAG: nucleoside recognition domain-containing protein [Lachnospiraceae bacterium]|nr:nucleoside recognition domain-containing protein [Lachnospiraceae bacterium]
MNRYLLYISEMAIPLVVFSIVGYALLLKKDVFDDFVKGATDGFKTVIKIMPTLIGLMVGVGVMRASGLFDFLGKTVGKLTEKMGLPSEILPLIIVRLFSSSAATGVTTDLFKTYGPDSYIGSMASIMMSCTETVFYTMAVYYGVTKVTKTRWTLSGALLATFAGIVASIILAGLS